MAAGWLDSTEKKPNPTDMSELDIKQEEFFRFRQRLIARTCMVAHCFNALRDGNRALCQKHYMQLWRARNPARAAYANLRDSARKRRLPFELSFDDFALVVGDTPYMEEKGTRVGCFHIDRIDPCLGYTVGNLRVIPLSENIAKGNKERRNYEYRRELLMRKGYSLEPYCDWVDDSELVCTEPQGNDPF